MIRRSLLGLTLALGLLPACGRPTEEDCRKAVQNIDLVLKRETDLGEQAAAIRKCRGAASKKAVRCWQNAKTEQDLESCESRPKK